MTDLRIRINRLDAMSTGDEIRDVLNTMLDTIESLNTKETPAELDARIEAMIP